MYTAKIKSKTQDVNSRLWTIVTEFTDGVDTFTESIIPQDRVGYEHWRNSRLTSLNGVTDLIAEDNIDVVVSLPSTPTPTQAELDKAEWYADVNKLRQAQNLLDMGVVLSAPQMTAISNLRTKIATNFQASYLG